MYSRVGQVAEKTNLMRQLDVLLLAPTPLATDFLDPQKQLREQTALDFHWLSNGSITVIIIIIIIIMQHLTCHMSVIKMTNHRHGMQNCDTPLHDSYR